MSLNGVFTSFYDLGPVGLTGVYSRFGGLLSVSLIKLGIMGHHQGSEVRKTRGF